MVYSMAGNITKAKENSLKAELSLSVLIGNARCLETRNGFRLTRQDRSTIQAAYQDEVTKRMCGAAYEYVYTQRSFKSVLHDAELIKIYFQAKALIDESERKPGSE